VLLLNLAGLGTRQEARVAAADARRAAQRIEATQARDLQHRVDRLQSIREEFDPGARPLPPGTGDGSPDALAARAQALADAIDAADREQRAQQLARLIDMPLDEARRKVDADEAARDPNRAVRIDGDTLVPYPDVVHLLDLCQFEGLTRVALRTRAGR